MDQTVEITLFVLCMIFAAGWAVGSMSGIFVGIAMTLASEPEDDKK